MWVLGVNWKWHDSSAALVDGDGRIWALAEEERFTQVKHAWGSLPVSATRHCLRTAGITWRDLDVIAVGWDLPAMGCWGKAERELLFGTLFGAEATGGEAPEPVFVGHHLAHALSTFHASGFRDAGVLVIDGSGESEAISIYTADRAAGLTRKRQWPRNYSLGTVYEATTQVLGLGPFETGKTMGLAPYGIDTDTTVLPIGDLLRNETIRGTPPFELPATTPYTEFIEAWMSHLTDRFGTVTNTSDQLHLDPVAVRLAASAQRTIEDAIRALYSETVCLVGSERVCLAGGVALNCVANGRLPDPVYVPPFPHDAGVALGAAWSICPPTRPGRLDTPYLGSELRAGDELNRLREAGCRVTAFTPQDVVEILVGGGIGAVAEGRAEVGPRALGHRSIVAVPRPAEMRDRINKLKGREPWRPLAPITLPDHANSLWPRQGVRELYMTGTAIVSSYAREVMPAATHVDGTTRPQVLEPGQAPVVEGLLNGLRTAGLTPVLVNTSFNGRGEPIVDSAADAARSFLDLGLDFLVLDGHLVRPGS